MTNAWMWMYNNERPHSSLDQRTPGDFLVKCENAPTHSLMKRFPHSNRIVIIFLTAFEQGKLSHEYGAPEEVEYFKINRLIYQRRKADKDYDISLRHILKAFSANYYSRSIDIELTDYPETCHKYNCNTRQLSLCSKPSLLLTAHFDLSFAACLPSAQQRRNK